MQTIVILPAKQEKPLCILASACLILFFLLSHPLHVGAASGALNVVPPTATISGGGNLCLGGGGSTITFTFTGDGPYTFIYAINGAAQAPITTSQTTYQIAVNPVGFTKYTLVSVSGPDGTGTVSGMAQFFVYVSSDANFAQDLTFCNSVNTSILVNVTGTAPFTVTYSINNVVQPAITTDEGPIFIPAALTATTGYSLISIESPGCLKSLDDSMTVTIHYTPSYSNVEVTCNPATLTYQVEFDVTGGTPPYTLLNGQGTFSGPHFTSQPVAQADAYSFTFRDAHNCGDVVVSGTTLCNCVSNAGAMSSMDTLTGCLGTLIQAAPSGNYNLDGNDRLSYILHDQPGTTAGQIIGWNVLPEFNAPPGVEQGKIYYISPVAGNDAGNGRVDLNDPCAKIGPGVPVRWFFPPGATLGADVNVCSGIPFSIPIAVSGTGGIQVVFTENGQQQSISGAAPTLQLNRTITADATYIIRQVTDSFCLDLSPDTLFARVRPAPQVTPATVQCDFAQQNYTVQFTVQSADPASVQISGGSGSYNALTGVFMSDPVPAANNYQFTVSDAYQCGSPTVQGVSPCVCHTVAGQLSSGAVLCYGDDIDLAPVTGAVLSSGDTLLYFLTIGDNPGNWSVIAQSGTPQFTFAPGQMFPGTTYHVTAVVGPKTSGGAIDMQHPCTRWSNGVTVSWKPSFSATLTGSGQWCSGDTISLRIKFNGGPANFSTTLVGNGFSQVIQNSTSNQTIVTIPALTSNTYSLSGLLADGCPGNVFGTAVTTVYATPQVVGFEQICSGDNLTYTLQFGISGGNGNPDFTIDGINGTFISDTVFRSDVYPVQTPYSFTIQTGAGCTATVQGSGVCSCASSAGTLTAGITEGCVNGKVSAIQNSLPVLDPNDGIVYALCSDPGQLPQSILATGTTPEFTYTPNWPVGVTLYIVALAGDLLAGGAPNYLDPCQHISNAIGVRFHPLPAAALSDVNASACQGEVLSFPVVSTGTAPFQLHYELNGEATIRTGLTAPIEFSFTAVQGVQQYVLTQISDQFCTGPASGAIIIDALPAPAIKMTGGASVCPGTPVELVFSLEYADSALIQVLRQPGTDTLLTLTPNGWIWGTQLQQSTTFTLGNVTVYGNNCPESVAGNAHFQVAPLDYNVVASDYNTFGVSCYASNDGSLTVSASGGGGAYSWQWNNGDTSSVRTLLAGGWHYLTLTDQYQCTLTDSILLRVPELMTLDFTLQPPQCIGFGNGKIIFEHLQGGVGPYYVAIDDFPKRILPQLPFSSPDLHAGEHFSLITDANGCQLVLQAQLPEPDQITVDAGADTEVILGDSILLAPVLTGAPLQDFFWQPDTYLLQTDTLRPWVFPTGSVRYILTVKDTAGCTATDDIIINVRQVKRVFVPNIITPESGDEQAAMTVFAGKEVSKVRSLQVFNRWGGLLFEQNNFLPNDPTKGWKGDAFGSLVQPGVYVWSIEIEKIDRSTEVIKGTVTVVR